MQPADVYALYSVTVEPLSFFDAFEVFRVLSLDSACQGRSPSSLVHSSTHGMLFGWFGLGYGEGNLAVSADLWARRFPNDGSNPEVRGALTRIPEALYLMPLLLSVRHCSAHLRID